MLIFLIPVSMIVKKHIEGIELFVTIEDVHKQQMPMIKKQDIVKPVIQKKLEPEPIKENMKPPEVPILVPQEKKEVFTAPVEKVVQHTVGEKTEEKSAPVIQAVEAERSFSPIETEFGTAVAPSFLHREMPVYPAFARRLGKEGRVVLRLTIDERGNLLNVEVMEKAGYGFTEAAVDAVKKSSFLPAKKNGKPVASRALLPVRFSLRRS